MQFGFIRLAAGILEANMVQRKIDWAGSSGTLFALANIILFPAWREIFTFTHTPIQPAFNAQANIHQGLQID